MATAIESGIGTTNYGRQSAKGTKATAATITVGYDRIKWTGDAPLKVNKKLGAKEYVDGQRFGSPTRFTDSVGGEVGMIGFHAQPENVGLYSAAILGVDTVTGASDPYTHTSTSAGTTGQWGTWWQKVGSAVGPVRLMFWDSKVAKLTYTSNFADKVLTGELDIQALSAEVYSTDPAKTEATSDPYLHTEAAGAFTLDSLVVPEVNEAVTTIDTKMSPYFGDNITPIHLIEGKGAITQSMKAITTGDTIGKFNKAVFGTATPSAGAVPVKDVFSAATSIVYTRSATRTFSIICPKVDIDPENLVIGAQAEGGPIPLDFTGTCRKDGSTPAITTVALTAESGSYA